MKWHNIGRLHFGFPRSEYQGIQEIYKRASNKGRVRMFLSRRFVYLWEYKRG